MKRKVNWWLGIDFVSRKWFRRGIVIGRVGEESAPRSEPIFREMAPSTLGNCGYAVELRSRKETSIKVG
jgi:hypothetical protein